MYDHSYYRDIDASLLMDEDELESALVIGGSHAHRPIRLKCAFARLMRYPYTGDTGDPHTSNSRKYTNRYV